MAGWSSWSLAASCGLGLAVGATCTRAGGLDAILTAQPARNGSSAVAPSGGGGQEGAAPTPEMVRMVKDLAAAIEAKRAEIDAAKAGGKEKRHVLELVEQLIRLKKEYAQASGGEWRASEGKAASGAADSGSGAAKKSGKSPKSPKSSKGAKQPKAKKPKKEKKGKQQAKKEPQQGKQKRSKGKGSPKADGDEPQKTLPAQTSAPAAVAEPAALPPEAQGPAPARFYVAPGQDVWVLDEQQAPTETPPKRPWRVTIQGGEGGSGGRSNYSLSILPAEAEPRGWAGRVLDTPREQLGVWPVGRGADGSGAVVWVPQVRLRARRRQEVHHGFICDRSGMSPIVGRRWKQRGADYDLCDAEYHKLSPEQQGAFDLIPASVSAMQAAEAAEAAEEQEESSEEEDDGGEPAKMMLVINQEVYRDGKPTKMRPGKVAAQCGHATLGCYLVAARSPADSPQLAALERWTRQGQMKITLKCPTVATMEELAAQAREAGIPSYLVRDAGHTQIDPGTRTVLAIGPALASVVEPLTGQLKLFA